MTQHYLQPLPGWDWAKVNWGAPDAPRTEHCSYCGVKLPDQDDPGYEIPLIVWTRRVIARNSASRARRKGGGWRSRPSIAVRTERRRRVNRTLAVLREDSDLCRGTV